MTRLLEHISPRTKILFFLVFLILLPGAILSYLGVRSISERAENLATTYRGTVNLVRDRIESEISGLEEAFRSSIADQQPTTGALPDVKRWLRGIELIHPGLGRFFLVSSRGGIISTIASLGWVRRGKEPEVGQIAQMTEFRSAEELEFIKKDYAAAVSLYTNARMKARTPADRTLALSRIGRCYFKMKRYQEGVAAYRKILTLSVEESGSAAIPPSVVALSQIADGYASLGKHKEREAAVFALYEYLLNHPWDLEGGDYSYYLTSTVKEVNAIVSNSSLGIRTERHGAELKVQENMVFAQLEFVRRIHQVLVPRILSERSRETLPETTPMLASLPVGDSIIDVRYLRLPGAFQQLNIVTIGYVLDEQYFVSTLLPRVLGAVHLGKDVVVGVLDPTGAPRFLQKPVPTATSLMTENFSQTFLLWKVALFDADGKTVEELVGREKDVYLALFLGTVAVMLIGTLVIGRAALHELEAARMKSEFVSSVSHELKTPLALIRMFGETLESGLVPDEARRQEFYRIITKESERLTHLINNVLDFSKMETGTKRYHLEEDDIVQVVRSTLEAYRFHIRDRGFAMVTQLPDEPILVMIDKDAMSQALLNLLNNAVKYSEEHKNIRVSIRTDEEWVLLSVEDRGVGIPQDELTNIFKKFYRATTTKTKETTGSGLGLTLVKHIMEAHAGSVEVKSAVGEGSTFILSIPLREATDA